MGKKNRRSIEKGHRQDARPQSFIVCSEREGTGEKKKIVGELFLFK